MNKIRPCYLAPSWLAPPSLPFRISLPLSSHILLCSSLTICLYFTCGASLPPCWDLGRAIKNLVHFLALLSLAVLITPCPFLEMKKRKRWEGDKDVMFFKGPCCSTTRTNAPLVSLVWAGHVCLGPTRKSNARCLIKENDMLLYERREGRGATTARHWSN